MRFFTAVLGWLDRSRSWFLLSAQESVGIDSLVLHTCLVDEDALGFHTSLQVKHQERRGLKMNFHVVVVRVEAFVVCFSRFVRECDQDVC